MCKVYGYCRISHRSQNIERQIRNIRAIYPDAIIIVETYTGTKIVGRKEFEKLARKVKPGDTIVFDSVSRMSRNAEEGFALYQQWFAEGVNLVFLKEQYVNTETYRQAIDNQMKAVATGDADSDQLLKGIADAINAYMLKLAERQIKIAFDQAQKEVDDLHQRTKEGIETARLNGKQIGQEAGRKLTVKKAITAKEQIRKHSKDFCGTLSDSDCIKLTGISRNSFYKYKKELREEMQ